MVRVWVIVFLLSLLQLFLSLLGSQKNCNGSRTTDQGKSVTQTLNRIQGRGECGLPAIMNDSCLLWRIFWATRVRTKILFSKSLQDISSFCCTQNLQTLARITNASGLALILKKEKVCQPPGPQLSAILRLDVRKGSAPSRAICKPNITRRRQKCKATIHQASCLFSKITNCKHPLCWDGPAGRLCHWIKFCISRNWHGHARWRNDLHQLDKPWRAMTAIVVLLNAYAPIPP